MLNRKHLFAVTLKKMMMTIPIEKITVQNVTKYMNIANQTFFYHFNDVKELLTWIYNQETDKQLLAFKEQHDWAENFEVFLNYIEDNYPFYLNTYQSKYRNLLEQFIYQVFFEMFSNTIDCCKIKCQSDFRDEVANFFGSAITMQVIQWIVTERSETKKEFEQRMGRILKGMISHVLTTNKDLVIL